MRSANIQSASRLRHVKRSGEAPVEFGRMSRAQSAPQLSHTPLSDPAHILPRLPAQALSPALFDLLDLMSGPILLIQDSPAGESEALALPGAAGKVILMQLRNDFDTAMGQGARMEHHRLRDVEKWTDSPHEHAAPSAIRSARDRLAAETGAAESAHCAKAKKPRATVLMFPKRATDFGFPPRAA